MTLRIGIITDIHCGPDMDTRLGSTALPLLDTFAEEMTRRFKPNLIVDLGDRINDVAAGQDAERILTIRSRLESVGVPVLFLYGNHDLINVGPAEQQRLLGKKADYESLDFRGFHLILLNSQDPTFGGPQRDPLPCRESRHAEWPHWLDSPVRTLLVYFACLPAPGRLHVLAAAPNRPARRVRAGAGPLCPLGARPGRLQRAHALEPHPGDGWHPVYHGGVARLLRDDRRPAGRRLHRGDPGRGWRPPGHRPRSPADDLHPPLTLPARSSRTIRSRICGRPGFAG
ncbi:MAG: metallophosphoesterase [candidate division NC10 bacterium]|nr:metallophosphoesterase [candidate division NC10 bacterium]